MSQSELMIAVENGAVNEIVMEPSPYGVDKKKLGMWIFIVSDACTFGAFLFAYGYMRIGTPVWGTPFGFSSMVNGMVMTAVLLSSSLTMLAAVRASQADDKLQARRWLGVTMLLGTIFAALHLREWIKLIGEGWRLFYNPTGGAPQFGATFFSVTGLHLTHVVTGVIALAFVMRGYQQGRYDQSHVETAGLYWHFVDVVWMFVFPLMYLMNAH